MRKLEDISVVINARVNSTRLHHKLIRKFYNDLTLLDLALMKLSDLDVPNKYLATCEDEILEIYRKYENNNIKLILRDKSSVESRLVDQNIIFAHYKTMPTSFIMSINPCMPFVKVETYTDILKYFISNEKFKTMTSIIKRDNIFFNSEFRTINVRDGVVVTQNNPSIYEMAHVFHIFNREQFRATGIFWDYTENNPGFFIVKDKLEVVDVDDEYDFMVANIIYSGTKSKLNG